MKIGLDLDDTVTELPVLFALLAQTLLAAGHEVHVITYREIGSEARAAQDLEDHGVRYTALHLPKRLESAPRFKARIAASLGLDLMIDDSPEVLAAMPPGVRRLWLCDPNFFDLGRCVQALNERP
jgi:hypothetical protein